MKINNISKKISNSMLGYLPVKIIEGIVGFITLKIYTTLFSPDVYGQYNLINPIISFSFLICLGWLYNSSLRYVNENTKDNKKKKQFFSTMILTWLSIILIILVIYGLLVIFFPGLLNNKDFNLLMILIAVFIGYSMNQILVSLLLYLGKRKLNIILVLFSCIAKLLLTIVLYNSLGENVIVIFISHSSIDLFTGIIALIATNSIPNISLKMYSKNMLIQFLKYGFPLIGLSLTMFLLNISDRYIINYVYDKYYVGIYSSNYSVAAAFFTVLMAGMNKGFFPKIIKAWSKKDTKAAEIHLLYGTRYFLMISFPAAIGLLVLSQPIGKLFLGIEYFEGNPVIGIIAVAMVFCGLSEYANKGWELSSKTLPILIHCLIATSINILLNIILIPRYGYMMAAYTTLISYIIYFLLSAFHRNKCIKWQIQLKTFINILIASIVMFLGVKILINIFTVNKFNMVIIALIGAIIYFVTLYIIGEIKTEINQFIKKN
ncbi:MAG: lipopolysaccharide biosynthesis protein [Vallitalea sp.]|jgi:O-antigen/teichoic acid export membrane protein|nr:lipopolysaccharide biosynthesis protein [Vallitalea sp.]